MHTQKTLRNSLIALAVMLSVAACGLLVVGGVAVVAVGVLFGGRGLSTSQESRAVVTRAMAYDDCTQVVSGELERHYEWDSPTPVDVTVTAYTPHGPADGHKVTVRQVVPSSAHLRIELTDEQAVAFSHPDARRTVSLRRADGQLLQDETEWK